MDFKEIVKEAIREELGPLFDEFKAYLAERETNRPGDPDLVTRTEAIAIKKCSAKTLYNWTKYGLLTPQHMGGRVYYSRKELNEIKKFRTNR